MSFIRKEKGPFDIIGDIHGCFFELEILLKRLGYTLSKKEEKFFVTHPDSRQVIFLGDLVDRGPRSAEVLKLVKDMVYSGIAFCVNGNHDDKLKRKLMGHNVKTNQDLEETLEQLNQETDVFREAVLLFLKELRDYYIFDDGKLVVSHAGLKEEYFGKSSKRIHAFCLYGQTTGELDEFSLPIRYPWAKDYRGKALVVYGHTALLKPAFLNNTLNIDTGCVFGGELTALRYPEKELVSVPALKVYYSPRRPLGM